MSLWICEGEDNAEVVALYKKNIQKPDIHKIRKTKPEYALYPLPFMCTGNGISSSLEKIREYFERKKEEDEEEAYFDNEYYNKHPKQV